MTTPEELLSKPLNDLEDHKIFSYRVKHLLQSELFWEYIGTPMPRNPLRWLALPENSGLSENFLFKIMRNDSTIAMERAYYICRALNLRLWQMTKPDYDLVAFLKENK